jgi:hypothetical protein
VSPCVQVEVLWVAHGLFMFSAWGVCIPLAVMAARFMKAYPNGLWLKVHQTLVALGLVLMVVGLVLALVADAGEIGLHASLGIVAIVLGGALGSSPLIPQTPAANDVVDLRCISPQPSFRRRLVHNRLAATEPPPSNRSSSHLFSTEHAWAHRACSFADGNERRRTIVAVVNPINGLLRPGKEPHEVKKRKVWEVGHRTAAAAGLVLAIAAMATGLRAMRNKGMRAQDVREYVLALAAWFGVLVVLCVLREVQLAYNKRGDEATRERFPEQAVPAYTEMTEVEVGGSAHSASTP